MRQALWTLATLLAHWRRRPGNLAALLVGLSVATALWSGVETLNRQARESYARAAAAFNERSLVSARGGLIPQEVYIKLRLAGFKVSPALEGTVRIGKSAYRLLGIDPVTAPQEAEGIAARDAAGFGGLLTPPGRTLASQQTLLELGAREGAELLTERGARLPPLQALATAPDGVLIVDIGAAQSLLDRPQRLSRLLLGKSMKIDPAALQAAAGDALRVAEAQETQDLEKLTATFHMNLTAFGLLAFLVGLFIVHASYGLAFEQRLPTIRTLRALGVSAHALTAAMLAEVTLFALLCGGIGAFCGYSLAESLLPDVAASLDSLYDARVSGRLAPGVGSPVPGLAMATLGALVAAAGGLFKAFRLPLLQAAQPFAWREAQQRQLRLQAAFAGAGLAAALAAFFFGQSLAAGFVMLAGLALGPVLLLPLLLGGALRAAEKRARGALSRWVWADSRRELSSLSLALMALLLALSTNIGVGGMVEGFRRTFTEWLDQRLIAEVYFEAASEADGRRIEDWLRKRPEVFAILPLGKTQTRLGGSPVDIAGMKPHETYRAHFPLLSGDEDAFDSLAKGEAALVSEQLARRQKLSLGSLVDLPTAGEDWRVRVVGIFPDYGNPKGQLRVDLDALERHWPQAQRTSFSLRTAPQAAAALIRDLQAAFGPKLSRIVDQATVKQLSTSIFERTFAVTRALNALTLLVSAIALLATLTNLSELRLAQLAPVWAQGVTRRRLIALELLRILFFAAATALAALPLGLAMSWCLVAVINVEAFGWRLPFYVFPAQWAEVFALALSTAFFSALAPLLRLSRSTPADLLKLFASEG